MKVWCLLRDQFAHINPVETALGNRAGFIYDSAWDPKEMLANRPDIVLCVNDYPNDVAHCIDAARHAGIPSLVLQDGILEWRCQYQNPLFGMGGGAPQHQPVLADKIACIGHQSVRQIAAWGNAGKVELTGMPRLDYLARREFPAYARPGCRLLVMTAKNPGFTPEQTRTTIQSLHDLKRHLEAVPRVKVFWRVAKSVAAEMAIDNQLNEISSLELTTLLEQVDAVVTTPSTAMLEAMLAGRPVAALDYHGAPRFVPTAWTISAREHIYPVISELLQPPASKMAFQQDCLADNLRADGHAAERVGSLLLKMVEAAKMNTGGTQFPPDMLEQRRTYHFFMRPTLASLYPEQPVFQETELEKLQVRLARSDNENARLKVENAELKKRVPLPSWLKKGARRLEKTAKAMNLLP